MLSGTCSLKSFSSTGSNGSKNKSLSNIERIKEKQLKERRDSRPGTEIENSLSLGPSSNSIRQDDVPPGNYSNTLSSSDKSSPDKSMRPLSRF